MKKYYLESIKVLLESEEYHPEILGFIYWLLFRLRDESV